MNKRDNWMAWGMGVGLFSLTLLLFMLLVFWVLQQYMAFPVKEAVDVVSKIVGISVAALGVWKGVESARKAVLEKRVENRHKQLSAAKSMLSEVFSDPMARSAMRMMDWSGRTYVHEGEKYVVLFRDLVPALEEHSEDRRFTPKESYIRDCFETFFDHMLILQHFIDQGYLHHMDVAVPLRYYARHIIAHQTVYLPFIEAYGYPQAYEMLKALERLPTFQSSG